MSALLRRPRTRASTRVAQRARITLLAAALAAAASLTACGGGSDAVVLAPTDPASFTDQIALRATAASTAGGPMTLLIPATTALDALSGVTSVGPFRTQTLNISSACTNTGGQLQYSAQDADNSGTFTQGDLVSLTFTNCGQSGDGVSLVLNGSIDMTVTVTRPGADVVSTIGFSPRNLSASLNGVAGTYAGQLGIENRFVGGNLNSTPVIAYVSPGLEVGFTGGRVDRISNVRWAYQESASAVSLSPAQTITLVSNGVTTTFSASTIRQLVFRRSSTPALDGVLIDGRIDYLTARDYMRSATVADNQLQISIDFADNGNFDRILNISAPQLLNSWN
ncbi:MAG TPA: hypothetical protein VFK82_00445 [Burkholderiaceae bacterium]|nr:hypothetical protein [Burkholderiaceae bacterium]